MNTDAEHLAYLARLDQRIAEFERTDTEHAFAAMTGQPAPVACRKACGREHPHYRARGCDTDTNPDNRR